MVDTMSVLCEKSQPPMKPASILSVNQMRNTQYFQSSYATFASFNFQHLQSLGLGDLCIISCKTFHSLHTQTEAQGGIDWGLYLTTHQPLNISH